MRDKKTIVIDFGKISTPHCGLAEVALNFSEALSRSPASNLEFTYIVPAALRDNFDRRVKTNKVLTPKYRGLNRVLYYLTGRTGFLCEVPEYDVYHYLHFYSPWGPDNSDKYKTLLTIHDFHALERSRSAKRFNCCLKKAGYIAFISNFACDEYERLVQDKQHVTKVIVNGVKQPPEVCATSCRALEERHGQFLFTLGGLKRKNVHSLLSMLQKLLLHDDNYQFKLLIAGDVKDKYKNELLAEAKDREILDRVVLLGPVSEQQKYQYMQACRAFVFPSLQEGFGLPIIEALHFGKPVFCSNKTSLPEVGGDQVYFWEDFDPDYMATVLLEGLADNDSAVESYTAERKQYARSFDWDENARQYVEYYESI